MIIKFGKFANLIVRNFVVIWEAPMLDIEQLVATIGKRTSRNLNFRPRKLGSISEAGSLEHKFQLLQKRIASFCLKLSDST